MCMDPDENLHLSYAFPGSKKPRHGAFTLIELMVVISIITLLLAILLPVLRHARVSSQRVVSVSNVRQISMSMHMYANDFKSSMPFLKQKALNPDGTVNTSDRWRPQWSKLLVDRGYLNGAQVYWSPGRAKSMASGIEDDRAEFIGQPRPNAYSYESVGYGMNVAVAGGTENDFLLGAAQAPLRLGEPQAPPPSQMVLLAETWSPSGQSATPVGSSSGLYTVISARYNLSSNVRLFNYDGGIVRSYVDGRAHAMASPKGVLVSGRQAHVGNSLYTPAHADEIGWDITRPPTSGIILPGEYAGYWSLLHLDDKN